MSLPAMLLHIGDYRRDTGHLRAAGHGAYLLLIMHYWATGGLPNDDEQLAAIACMSDPEWQRWRPVLEKFFSPGWKHKRIETELAKAKAQYQRRADAGRKGGGAKAAAKQCYSNATALPQQPKPKTKEEDGGGDARASLAFELTLKIGVISGYADASYWPPGWVQAPRRVQLMLDYGWKPEIMLDAAREAMARKRDGPPSTIGYFEKPFARAHARAAQPLPKVEIVNAPNQRELTLLRPVGGGGAANGSIVAAGKRRLAELAEFQRQQQSDAAGLDREGDARNGPGHPDVRLLSQG